MGIEVFYLVSYLIVHLFLFYTFKRTHRFYVTSILFLVVLYSFSPKWAFFKLFLIILDMRKKQKAVNVIICFFPILYYFFSLKEFNYSLGILTVDLNLYLCTVITFNRINELFLSEKREGLINSLQKNAFFPTFFAPIITPVKLYNEDLSLNPENLFFGLKKIGFSLFLLLCIFQQGSLFYTQVTNTFFEKVMLGALFFIFIYSLSFFARGACLVSGVSIYRNMYVPFGANSISGFFSRWSASFSSFLHLIIARYKIANSRVMLFFLTVILNTLFFYSFGKNFWGPTLIFLTGSLFLFPVIKYDLYKSLRRNLLLRYLYKILFFCLIFFSFGFSLKTNPFFTD
ncbi:MAG: hypothetical protein CME61_03420, partial [Halobacteriovoraceae bacterium]|nr:hypothetical protein [Halobacteriovoraceae bacterium]